MEYKVWYRYLGKYLRKCRLEAELTQEILAERADISAKFLGDVERGQAKPSFDTVFTLLKVLKKNPKDFFRL